MGKNLISYKNKDKQIIFRVPPELAAIFCYYAEAAGCTRNDFIIMSCIQECIKHEPLFKNRKRLLTYAKHYARFTSLKGQKRHEEAVKKRRAKERARKREQRMGLLPEGNASARQSTELHDEERHTPGQDALHEAFEQDGD